MKPLISPAFPGLFKILQWQTNNFLSYERSSLNDLKRCFLWALFCAHLCFQIKNGILHKNKRTYISVFLQMQKRLRQEKEQPRPQRLFHTPHLRRTLSSRSDPTPPIMPMPADGTTTPERFIKAPFLIRRHMMIWIRAAQKRQKRSVQSKKK